MGDDKEVRERLDRLHVVRRTIRQVKEGIAIFFFSFLVIFTTFPRQTSILRCVIMVDVFSHLGGCCIFTISTFRRIQPRVLCIRSTTGFSSVELWNEVSAFAHDAHDSMFALWKMVHYIICNVPCTRLLISIERTLIHFIVIVSGVYSAQISNIDTNIVKLRTQQAMIVMGTLHVFSSNGL